MGERETEHPRDRLQVGTGGGSGGGGRETGHPRDRVKGGKGGGGGGGTGKAQAKKQSRTTLQNRLDKFIRSKDRKKRAILKQMREKEGNGR